MSGGTITGNSASASGGGIFLHERNNIQLSGSPKITGNTVKHKANNIYLAENAKAIITNKLTTPGGTSKPQIGISMYRKGVFTQDLSGSLVDGTTVKDLFSSDCLAYILTETDNHEAQLERVVDMSGEGTEDSPYEITKYADLQEFAAIVNGTHLKAPIDTDAYGKLMNDIDCSGYKDWVPIGDTGYYTGHFDGNHKVIRNLSNENKGTGKDRQGLFGEIGSDPDLELKGEVKDVGLVGGKIIGRTTVGGVVGYNQGTITNCYNTGAVSGDGQLVSGVVGDNQGGEITNCYNTGTISGGGGQVGGVVGRNSGGTITNSYNTGAVSGDVDVGGVVGGDSGGTITNSYNTGAVSGNKYVGGVAGSGFSAGTITNCYNTGTVSGTGDYYVYVGGVTGFASETITNNYNTGAVSGNSTVGGVAGYAGGATNCYNAGAVSGTGDQVGGVAGLAGGATNCYNAGAVSGTGDKVGSVAGQANGTITNCYYDRTFNLYIRAVGNGSADDTVKGLTTAQMTGEDALSDSNMKFSYTDPSKYPWLPKTNGEDSDSGACYLYYPHLKGFAYDTDPLAANWPAKLIAATEWSSEAASYPYTASPQGPAVTKVTISQKPVKIPKDKTGLYSRQTDSGWDALTAAPTGKGTYKLTIKDGDDIIDEIVFVIFDPAADYTVDYYKQTEETGWTKIGSSNPVDAGKYKAAVTLSDGTVLGEKVFQIKKAPLTITAKDQTRTYNGEIQGEGDTAYEDAAQIAEKVTVKGLQGSDELTKIEVDGQGKEVGEYVLRPNDAAVGTVTDNYDINYVNGTLTITKMSITPSVSIEGWVYGSAENKPVVTGNTGGGKETFLYKKTDEPDSAYTETVPTDAGEYTVKAKIAETANYKAGEATVDFTISPADMEVTAGDYQGTYDGAGHGITVNAPEGATVEYSADGGESWSGEKPVFTEAGTHNTDFRVSLANYKEYTGSRQVIILQAAITIKADDKSSKYGETLKKLTYKVSGAYVKGDDLGVKLSTAAKKTAPGTTAIKVSWNRDPNYEAKLVNGKYTVKKENTKPSGPTKAEKKAARIALDAGVVARSSGNKVTASWGAVRGASSYAIYANYCDQKKCKKIKTVSGKTTSFNITKVNGKKFDPKKNLKFYVVAYKTVKGKKVKLATSITAHAPGSKNSKRTNVTGVKVKKASFTLKKGKTAKIKAKLILQKKNRKPLKHEAKFRYATSNAKVAKVSKKGKITAVGKGKCTVYVYAVSGVSKKIKVTVK